MSTKHTKYTKVGNEVAGSASGPEKNHSLALAATSPAFLGVYFAGLVVNNLAMKLPLILVLAGLAGLTMAHAQTASAVSGKDPFAAASGPAADTSLGSGFANFCREHPSVPGPVGDKPLWLEYFIGYVAADQTVANVSAAEMVAQGKGEWGCIEARTNSSASGWSVYTIERAPDGRLLEANERREIGTSIYLHLFPDDDGRVAVQLRKTELKGWAKVNAGAVVQQPIYSSREITTNLNLGTQWVSFGGLNSEQVTRHADGTEQVNKISSLIFCRLVSEKPGSAPQTITVSVQRPSMVLPKKR